MLGAFIALCVTTVATLALAAYITKDNEDA